MAHPLVHVDQQRVVDPRRSRASGRITARGDLLDVVGRAFAIALGLGILLAAGAGAASLTVIGILAIGSALVSWSE